ncbi:hypothetical protein ACFQH6_02375 [Halobacteriaceae archaeon GCM10025711]
MPSPSTSRRGFLAAAGAAALAGCSTVERVASSGDRAALRDALGDVPAVSRGVSVTADHVQSAQSRFESELSALQSLVEVTEQREAMERDVAERHRRLAQHRKEIAAMTDDWETVDELRFLTAAAVNQAAYLRAWRGELTPADVRSALDDLRTDLGDADDRLAYDRGTRHQVVPQLALAEERLRRARDVPEYLQRNLSNIRFESLDAARADGDPNADYAWPVAHVASGVARGRLHLEDVSRLVTAHPRSEAHADSLVAAYDALHPEVRARYEEASPMDRWYEYGMPHVAKLGSADDFLGRAAEFRERGHLGTAVRETLLASVVLPAQVELTDRLPALEADSLTPEHAAAVGKGAHVAFRGAVENAASVVGLSLLHPVREALVTADDAVRRSSDGNSVRIEALRKAYLRYAFVASASRAVPDAVRRFERTG